MLEEQIIQAEGIINTKTTLTILNAHRITWMWFLLD